MNCPICNKEITLNTKFCEQCNFEIHILPDGVSDAVRAYEHERIERYNKLMQQISESETRTNKLSNQLMKAIERADAAEERIAENTKEIQRILMENNELLEKIKAHDVERPIAFLVVMQDEEMVTGTINRRVTDVFPVLHGKNVFGKNPKEDSDVHSQKIIYCKEMQAEHFLLEGKTDNSFIIQNISGTTFLRNKSNNLNSTATDLYDGDEIFIGDLVFVFISK